MKTDRQQGQTVHRTATERQKKYINSDKGKESLKKAQEKYDKSDVLKRRQQKRDYMRRKRAENPNYCKWK